MPTHKKYKRTQKHRYRHSQIHEHTHLCMYYVCMYPCTYVRMYASMYVRRHVCMHCFKGEKNLTKLEIAVFMNLGLSLVFRQRCMYASGPCRCTIHTKLSLSLSRKIHKSETNTQKIHHKYPALSPSGRKFINHYSGLALAMICSLGPEADARCYGLPSGRGGGDVLYCFLSCVLSLHLFILSYFLLSFSIYLLYLTFKGILYIHKY